MRFSLAFCVWVVLAVPTLSLAFSGARKSSDPYLALAAFYAPVLEQETGGDPKADAITRFDFDGDHAGDNNWENLPAYPTPAWVYYDVIESETHYFLNYAFFHPRDYASFCVPYVCHENDLEGVLLVVRKTKGSAYGILVAMQALAHDVIRTYTTDISFSKDGKARVFIEAGGHGAWGKRSQRAGLTYSYGGFPEDPRGAARGSFRYDLLSTHEELWKRVMHPVAPDMFMNVFEFGGSRFNIGTLSANFLGDTHTPGRARPPWAWKDNDSGLQRGDWFLDPAYAVQGKLPTETISLNYLHNPYLIAP